MTDVTSPPGPSRRTPASPESHPRLPADPIACAELLFFAYRDFTGDPDAVLEQYGFGRAHHRVLHFVNRNPGLRVANLLDILKITKQSLARVLKQLIEQGFIVQRAGDEDRRERLLTVTAKGARLAEKLAALQVRRIEAALSTAGPGADEAARRFLFAMIAEAERPRVEALIKASTARSGETRGGRDDAADGRSTR
jgi:DNA-binding MarR family transcriptional regulator